MWYKHHVKVLHCVFDENMSLWPFLKQYCERFILIPRILDWCFLALSEHIYVKLHYRYQCNRFHHLFIISQCWLFQCATSILLFYSDTEFILNNIMTTCIFCFVQKKFMAGKWYLIFFFYVKRKLYSLSLLWEKQNIQP